MIARAAAWAEVQFGSFVQDPSGNTWRVDELRGVPTLGEVLLSNREGQRIVFPWPETTTPVVIVEPTDEEAVATLEATLGAEVMGVRDGPRKPMRCKKLARAKEGTIHMHMLMFHGVYTKDSHDIPYLRKTHDEDHTDPIAPHNFVNHSHE